ncbi:hypothetical protein DFH06DRAFT_1330719 [Mycena polygramma]|nr:hypothetical protein DFH06DRAFT_1330719 [Mycena polygramma]
MINGLAPRCRDPCVPSARIQEANDRWQAQMPLIVDMYFKLKHDGPATLNDAAAWSLEVLSFSECGLKYFSHSPSAATAKATLLSFSYIGTSPEQPVLAFPIALFKTLQHLHKVLCTAYLDEQITTAYDTYLAIMCGIDVRVTEALGRTSNWSTEGK